MGRKYKLAEGLNVQCGQCMLLTGLKCRPVVARVTRSGMCSSTSFGTY